MGEEQKQRELSYEERLLLGVKNDFFLQTGKHIKLETCSSWQSKANFVISATWEQIAHALFDHTGWKYDDTFCPAIVRKKGVKNRTNEQIYRRGLIDYTAINNGCTLVEIASKTGRDHTSVMNSIKKFQDRLDTDGYVRQSFMEIIDWCRNNFYLYK